MLGACSRENTEIITKEEYQKLEADYAALEKAHKELGEELHLKENICIRALVGPEVEEREQPEVYEHIAGLLAEARELSNEVLYQSAEYFEHNNEENELILNGERAFMWPIEKEGVTGWKYFTDKAERVYSDSYIDNYFTPQYFGEGKLFWEVDGQLYRADGDAMQPVFSSKQLKVESFGENYVAWWYPYEEQTGRRDQIEIIYIKVNEKKVYGLEIEFVCRADILPDSQSEH